MSTDDFTIRLEQVFQGPMDLLLHLVREQEMEIHEIEITRIVDGYLAYLKQLEELDIEFAGEFVVMAATLMAIKSRSLLPTEEVDLEDDLDPRDELIERLIEYRRFREASEGLEERGRVRAMKHSRGYRGEVKAHEEERVLDLGDLDRWDLLGTFSRLMRETLADRPHRVAFDPRPLRFYVDTVVQRMKADKKLSLGELIDVFEGVPTREAVVGSFCALLELVRVQVITIEQEGQGDDIAISIRADHEDDIDEVVQNTGLADEELEEGADEAPAETPAKTPEGAPTAVRNGSAATAEPSGTVSGPES